MRNLFSDHGKTFNLIHSGDGPASSRLESNVDGIPMVFQQRRVLCDNCNGGWMSRLEEEALDAVAAMAQDGSLDMSRAKKNAIAAWAVSVAILRAELASRMDPFDNRQARAFRNDGLGALRVEVWAVRLEITSALRLNGDFASTYFHAANADFKGGVYFHMLRHVGILVATEDFADQAAWSMPIIASAANRLWPSTDDSVWPPDRTVDDRTVMRVAGMTDDLVPAGFFEERPGKRPRLRYVLRPPHIFEQSSYVHHELMAQVLAKLMKFDRQNGF